MRIATWNVERLKHNKDREKMLAEIEKVAADILVLTETDERLKPDYPYCYKTPLLKYLKPDYYKAAENRVSIYTKYNCMNEYATYDKYTAICVELQTEYGNLLIYATIMGIFGNREKSFKADLEKQMTDIKKFSDAGHRICVIGDYNISFSDNYYYTKFGRETVNRCFDDNNIFLITRNRLECIDHIAISDDFMQYSGLTVAMINEWNYDKSLSDHKGIVVDIQPQIHT